MLVFSLTSDMVKQWSKCFVVGVQARDKKTVELGREGRKVGRAGKGRDYKDMNQGLHIRCRAVNDITELIHPDPHIRDLSLFEAAPAEM